jgi:hypothetical protein
MLERLREQSLKEPEPELVEEERENPLKRFSPSALGLTPRQTFLLAIFFLLDVMFFSCICLIAAGKVCPPFIAC